MGKSQAQHPQQEGGPNCARPPRRSQGCSPAASGVPLGTLLWGGLQALRPQCRLEGCLATRSTDSPLPQVAGAPEKSLEAIDWGVRLPRLSQVWLLWVKGQQGAHSGNSPRGALGIGLVSSPTGSRGYLVSLQRADGSFTEIC